MNVLDFEKITGLSALFFITFITVGFYLSYLYGRKTKNFRFREYVAMMSAPILAVLILGYFYDLRIYSLFIISSAVGFTLEILFGYTYYKVLNKKLWLYDSRRMSVSGYSSLLTLPIWGVAGIVFWYLSKIVGL